MEVVAAEAASQEARRLVLARDAAEGGAAALLEQLQAAHSERERLEARVAQLDHSNHSPYPEPYPYPYPCPCP